MDSPAERFTLGTIDCSDRVAAEKLQLVASVMMTVGAVGMPRVHYSAILDRFSHIDATLVGFDYGDESRTAHLRVRFYPWWEHPFYVRARERDEPWGFAPDDDAEKEVIVHAKNLRSLSLSDVSTTPRYVTEWRFERHHPLLLRYEPSVRLFCNSAMAPEQALRIIDVVEESVCGWLPPWEFLNATSTAAFIKLARNSSFLLGEIPSSLAPPLQSALQECGVSLSIPAPAASHPRRDTPTLLLLDELDYLISDDFEVDVPEFVHRPEYFKP